MLRQRRGAPTNTLRLARSRPNEPELSRHEASDPSKRIAGRADPVTLDKTLNDAIGKLSDPVRRDCADGRIPTIATSVDVRFRSTLASATLPAGSTLPDPSSCSPMVRIGWGYDIHRLYPGRPTVLGGVAFPDFPHGFDTHTDGDVVAHAIIDALAGALAVGSLGDYFAEDDPADQDARSIEFLQRFRPVMAKERAEVVNLDCTIFCTAPRIGPVAPQMRANIAAGLGCGPDRINVKGKTNDGFGPEGQGHAISATVLVQLQVDLPGQ